LPGIDLYASRISSLDSGAPEFQANEETAAG
jgi:hypothetical protein